MRELVLCNEDDKQEVLISYKGLNFMVRNSACGQYGFERRVGIFIVKDNLELVKLKSVGVLRLFSGNDIKKQSESTQCLIVGETHFEQCLDEAKAYIKKYIDFISE